MIINGPLIQLSAQGAGADIGNGQLITKTLGTHTQHAANHIITGPAAPNFTPPGMPKSELKTDEKFVLYDAQTGEPVPNRRYRIATHDKQIIEGTSDAKGRTDLPQSQSIGVVDIKVFPDDGTPT